jgi:hypothetical protein
MENVNHNLLDEFSAEKLQPVRRRKIFPVWIKIFVWIFMIMGGCAVPVLIIGLFGTTIDLELYGLKATEATSVEGLLLLFLFIYKGVVAALLWFERGPAVAMAIIDAALGIMICTWVMFAGPHFAFRFELVALVPYLIVMFRIRKRWEAWIPNLH